MKRLKILWVALAVLIVASPAHADWRRAESERFIVFSEGSERELRDYVRKLEIYDGILRARLNIQANPWDRKLPIYLVSRRELREVRPDVGSNVAGFYMPAGEDIFAVAQRGRDSEFVLLHEYVHHLSHQTGAMSAYPGWLIEGLAEYYMTADIRDDQVEIGEASAERAYWLFGADWIRLEDLLTKRPSDIRRSADAATYYPVSWALTHWFMSDPDRHGRLETFVDAVARGEEPVAAMTASTGLSTRELTQAVRSYLRGRIPARRYEFAPSPVEIEVTTLPRVEGELLLLAQRAKAGMGTGDERERSMQEIRQRTARHPDSPFAQKLLGHAEAHTGDRLKGEALLNQYLASHPEDVEALQWLAASILHRAREDGDADLTLTREARALLARAYQAEPENYHTLELLAESRQAADDYPTANDIETWRQAFALAPQLASLRLGFASALIQSGEADEAVAMLEPLSNAPHGGAGAEAAATLIAQARSGEAPLNDEQIKAAVEADEQAQPEPTEPDSGLSEPSSDDAN